MPRPYVARLLPNGTVDTSFNPGLGPNAVVRAIALQPDGGVLIGGSFTSVNGTNRNSLARLKADGSLDLAFMAESEGGNGAVYGLTLQPDSAIIVVGDFTIFDGVTRNRITRLDAVGKTDPNINFGEGANSFIATALVPLSLCRRE